MLELASYEAKRVNEEDKEEEEDTLLILTAPAEEDGELGKEEEEEEGFFIPSSSAAASAAVSEGHRFSRSSNKNSLHRFSILNRQPQHQHQHQQRDQQTPKSLQSYDAAYPKCSCDHKLARSASCLVKKRTGAEQAYSSTTCLYQIPDPVPLALTM